LNAWWRNGGRERERERGIMTPFVPDKKAKQSLLERLKEMIGKKLGTNPE
jgi:hypothetical protein